MSRTSLVLADDGLAILTLERADARNAIDPEMVESLARATKAVAAHRDARALLIRAEGPAFSVGGDLGHLGARADRLREELEPMVSLYHESLHRLAELPMPVVCAAKGAVAGGALGLLWVADISIVADDTKLAAGFLALGLSGDGGSSWWLPRLIGLQRARELLLQGRVISGDEAAGWGLVTRSVSPDRVDDDAKAAARTLAALPPTAYAETRSLLAKSLERTLGEGLAAEHQAMLRTATTDEARERVAGFATRSPRAPLA